MSNGDKNILIIDDVAENLKVLSEHLIANGYRVRPVKSGALAFKTIEIETPDLILLDIKMPDMDGYEVCRLLKANEKTKNIPIIFISAYGELSEKIKAFEAGGIDYITKPFQSSELLVRVKTHLELSDAKKSLELINMELERKVIERTKEISRLNRLYEILSHTNQCLIKVSSRKELFEQVCKIAVERGMFQLAWIGENDLKTMEVNPVAWAGEPLDYIRNITIFSDERPEGLGPTGTAIREGKPKICNDFLNSNNTKPWQKAAKGANIRASGAFPVKLNETVFGALTVYACDKNFFQAKEVALLEEVAMSISFGIAHMENDEHRKKAEEEIHRLNEDLQIYAAELENRVAERTAELAVALEHAKESDRLKSAFLATMSHELRTPLNSIIGFTGIMLMGLVGPIIPEQEKQLIMVQDSARHLLELINDVLDISKIEAGQFKLDPAPFDIKTAVDKSLEKMAPLAKKKGLTLTAVTDPSGSQAIGDRRRVEQIIINLLSNAVKFTDKGEVRIESRSEGKWIVTRVTDTGIGIKEEELVNLFKPFRQVDTGISRQYEGTGLGLSICKKLVEAMGGKIYAESKFGSGSIFTFTIPIERKEKNETSNPGY